MSKEELPPAVFQESIFAPLNRLLHALGLPIIEDVLPPAPREVLIRMGIKTPQENVAAARDDVLRRVLSR